MSDLLSQIISVVVLVLVVIGAYKLHSYFKKWKKSKEQMRRYAEILLDVVGKPSTVDEFSLEEFQSWIQRHRKVLNGKGKALAAKLETVVDRLKGELKDFNFASGDYSKSLFLAVTDDAGDIKEKAVIVYGKLTREFEEALTASGGWFTVRL